MRYNLWHLRELTQCPQTSLITTPLEISSLLSTVTCRRKTSASSSFPSSVSPWVRAYAGAPLRTGTNPPYSPQRHTSPEVPCLVALPYRGPCSDGRDSGLVRTAVVILRAAEPDSICDPVRGHRNSSSFLPSQTLRVICTIVAPTPFVGAIFITFGRIINKIGPQYSRLSPRLCE